MGGLEGKQESKYVGALEGTLEGLYEGLVDGEYEGSEGKYEGEYKGAVEGLYAGEYVGAFIIVVVDGNAVGFKYVTDLKLYYVSIITNTKTKHITIVKYTSYVGITTDEIGSP